MSSDESERREFTRAHEALLGAKTIAGLLRDDAFDQEEGNGMCPEARSGMIFALETCLDAAIAPIERARIAQ